VKARVLPQLNPRASPPAPAAPRFDAKSPHASVAGSGLSAGHVRSSPHILLQRYRSICDDALRLIPTPFVLVAPTAGHRIVTFGERSAPSLHFHIACGQSDWGNSISASHLDGSASWQESHRFRWSTTSTGRLPRPPSVSPSTARPTSWISPTRMPASSVTPLRPSLPRLAVLVGGLGVRLVVRR
jgi:hypothetical protein